MCYLSVRIQLYTKIPDYLQNKAHVHYKARKMAVVELRRASANKFAKRTGLQNHLTRIAVKYICKNIKISFEKILHNKRFCIRLVGCRVASGGDLIADLCDFV